MLHIIFRARITYYQKKVVTLCIERQMGVCRKGMINQIITPTAKMDESAKISIGKVAALKKLRDKVNELSDTMKELGEPILDDLALLPAIYEAYKRVFQRRGCQDDVTSVRNRKKFLMVILYLYSPKALAGDRMRMGLRKKVSELFGLTTSTPISDNCAGLIVQYRAYADFRRDVDLIFQEVLNSLDDKLIVTD